ncbi:MAG: hypothetical protein LKG19_08215 [Saprospiraceae bacterium]|nr:hypothetical protein [Saprospiraceae bacterium]
MSIRDYKINKIIWILLIVLNINCKEQINTPKPRMYPFIDFPEKSYIHFSQESCPFNFNFPKYSSIEKDTTFFDEMAKSDCWFNIVFESFNGKIHCSYFPIQDNKQLKKYIDDAYKLMKEHQHKADFIDELPIHKPNHVSGMLFNIEGAAASPFQFYLTDSLHHFLRGSLYFNAQTKPDSMAPIFQFVKKDIIELINTFEWK